MKSTSEQLSPKHHSDDESNSPLRDLGPVKRRALEENKVSPSDLKKRELAQSD